MAESEGAMISAHSRIRRADIWSNPVALDLFSLFRKKEKVSWDYSILAAQKRALGFSKHDDVSKTVFSKDIWKGVVDAQDAEIEKALCGQSDNCRLTEECRYLQVSMETWFPWKPAQRKRLVTHKAIHFTYITNAPEAVCKAVCNPWQKSSILHSKILCARNNIYNSCTSSFYYSKSFEYVNECPRDCMNINERYI